MALFDFLKRKKKEEMSSEKRKHESVPSENSRSTESSSIAPRGDYREDFSLIAPHITERSRGASLLGAYVFKVQGSASKRKIAHSVEDLYKVHVEKVRIIKSPPKPRRRGQSRGTHPGFKKAVVTLKKGESLEIFS